MNAEDFPSAAMVQAEAEAVVAQCIRPGMTEFERAKALLDWMLCRMAGLRCVCISSDTLPGGATLEKFQATHRLTALLLDGEMYYADTYWGAAGSGYMKPQYKHFLMTTEQAAQYYTWDGRLGIPETAATTYAVDPVTGELLG